MESRRVKGRESKSCLGPGTCWLLRTRTVAVGFEIEIGCNGRELGETEAMKEWTATWKKDRENPSSIRSQRLMRAGDEEWWERRSLSRRVEEERSGEMSGIRTDGRVQGEMERLVPSERAGNRRRDRLRHRHRNRRRHSTAPGKPGLPGTMKWPRLTLWG